MEEETQLPDDSASEPSEPHGGSPEDRNGEGRAGSESNRGHASPILSLAGGRGGGGGGSGGGGNGGGGSLFCATALPPTRAASVRQLRDSIRMHDP